MNDDNSSLMNVLICKNLAEIKQSIEQNNSANFRRKAD